MRILFRMFGLILAAEFSVIGFGQAPGRAAPAGADLAVASSSATEKAALQGNGAEWANAASRRIALNRTPPLFDTDEPAAAEITSADVRCIRAGGKLYVQLTWHDATRRRRLPRRRTRARKSATKKSRRRRRTVSSMLLPLWCPTIRHHPSIRRFRWAMPNILSTSIIGTRHAVPC